MKIISVNVGMPVPVEWNGGTVLTGIFKSPVTGPQTVGFAGFAADGQADLANHGGRDKAVYLYPHEHYPWWAGQLDRDELQPGQFGENLTSTGLLEDAVHVGDRFRIGSVVVEATQPRIPCFKLGIRMGDPAIVKRFLDSGRTGIYFRVIEPGQLQDGDTVDPIHTDPAQPSIRDVWQTGFFNSGDAAAVRSILAAPALADAWRSQLAAQLTRLES